MKIWKDLDDGTQKIIKVLALLLAIVIIAFCWINVIKMNNQLNDYIVLNRSPIREVRLISAEKKEDGYYVTVVDKQTAKRYENVYVTKTCPSFRSVPGTSMNISVIFKENPTTGEQQFELGRVYDYICTKKNMEAIDRDFLDKLNKADEEYSKTNPGNTPISALTNELSPEAKLGEKEALDKLNSLRNR